MLCAVLYHLYNLKNKKPPMVEFQPAILLKATLLHECFSCLLNCTIVPHRAKRLFSDHLAVQWKFILIISQKHVCTLCMLHSVQVWPPQVWTSLSLPLLQKTPLYGHPPYIFPKPPSLLIRLFRQYRLVKYRINIKKNSRGKVISSFLQD